MPDNNTVERAEQRVREMDRLTRQFSEQGNRYMRNMQNMRNRNTANVINAVTDANAANTGSASDSRSERANNIPRSNSRGTRFEPVEKIKNVPQIKELPKKEAENAAVQNKACTANKGIRNSKNQGIDGEKLLLIALMYLLITENADIKLILAIGYLIL